MLTRPSLPALALALLLSSLTPSAHAESQPPPRQFDISQGDLANALRTFSQQADAPVMTFVDIRGKRGRRVFGVLPPESALAQLISGEGLRMKSVAGGYVLREADPWSLHPTPSAKEAPAAADAPVEVEQVIVTGFRGSLVQARDLKRQALGAQDVIVAEDIAAFPDLNLAESLQRIPGVTISRDTGEGRQIALRGLGPDFTRTQLNGMEVSASTASGFDNRGSVSRTRAFDYSIFASELFNRVTVRKAYAVDEDEGGVAGTVELRTAKPFDYPGFKAALSAKALGNSVTDGITPRLAGLISNRWGDVGVLVSAAYSESDVNEYGYRNWGWTPINVAAANIGPGVSAADRDRLANATGNDRVRAPQAQTYSTWFDHRERLGVTAALQYRPSADTSLDVDLLYGRLSNDRNEFSLASAGKNGLTGDVIGTQRLNSVTIRGDDMVQAAFDGVDLRSEHKHSTDSTVFTQVAVNGRTRLTDDLEISGMVGHSRSDFEGPVFDKVFLQASNKAFSFDLRGPGRDGINTYGFNPADPNAWSLMRADTREDEIVNDFTTGRLDLTYAAGSRSTLKAGAQYKLFRNDGYQRRNRVDYDGTPILPTSMKFVSDERSLIPYVVGDVDAVYALLGQKRDLSQIDDQPGSDYSLTEKTAAAYVQYLFDGELAGRRLRADAGLRYYNTRLTSAGMVSNGVTLAPAVIAHRYNGVLPAVNLAWDLDDDIVLRLAANRDISRPSLSDLRAAASVDAAPFGGTITVGNPDLRPFMANSIEASLEFYQGHAGALAISVFHKTMESFITSEEETVPYGSTGYPLQFLNPGQTGSIMYNVVRPVNGDGASIQGVELAWQRDFDFLPAPLDKLGFTGNITYAHGRTDAIIDGKSILLDLPQLSRWTWNATLYYESARWGARVSSAYRDGYLDGAGGNGNIGSGYHAMNNIDAAAHLNIGRRLKMMVEGLNLTDQAIDQYTDIAANRLLARTRSGRTVTLGVAYEF
ncbi:TonB-dependent receptor [Caulobacter soli]|uniref:TonB-dependent receptor n=1 Tax=Caulobacter soli TaxID=2708539 RepID=UPI001FE8FCF8|nr:TonB-dependent receptor [Caulobacter soli]